MSDGPAKPQKKKARTDCLVVCLPGGGIDWVGGVTLENLLHKNPFCIFWVVGKPKYNYTRPTCLAIFFHVLETLQGSVEGNVVGTLMVNVRKRVVCVLRFG